MNRLALAAVLAVATVASTGHAQSSQTAPDARIAQEAMATWLQLLKEGGREGLNGWLAHCYATVRQDADGELCVSVDSIQRVALSLFAKQDCTIGDFDRSFNGDSAFSARLGELAARLNLSGPRRDAWIETANAAASHSMSWNK